MKIVDCYTEIALRSLESAKRLHIGDRDAQALFHVYHAFESIGCALLEHHGLPTPTSHKKKITQFVKISQQYRDLCKRVPALANVVNSMRNMCLYPVPTIIPGEYKTPDELVSSYDINRLIARTEKVVQCTIQLI